jgi:hypothetical protein
LVVAAVSSIEGQSFRIKGRLCFSQGLTSGGDVIPILFCRADTLF